MTTKSNIRHLQLRQFIEPDDQWKVCRKQIIYLRQHCLVTLNEFLPHPLQQQCWCLWEISRLQLPDMPYTLQMLLLPLLCILVWGSSVTNDVQCQQMPSRCPKFPNSNASSLSGSTTCTFSVVSSLLPGATSGSYTLSDSVSELWWWLVKVCLRHNVNNSLTARLSLIFWCHFKCGGIRLTIAAQPVIGHCLRLCESLFCVGPLATENV